MDCYINYDDLINSVHCFGHSNEPRLQIEQGPAPFEYDTGVLPQDRSFKVQLKTCKALLSQLFIPLFSGKLSEIGT